jgi:hypothetical protein
MADFSTIEAAVVKALDKISNIDKWASRPT